MLSLIAAASAQAACTASGGLGRFTLGLDPAMTCADPSALERVLAFDLPAVAAAGDVIERVWPASRSALDIEYRFLRPQPLRGLLAVGIATARGEAGDRLVLAWDEPIGFLKPHFERAGWRLRCRGLGSEERCEAERVLGNPHGTARAARLELVSRVEPARRIRAFSFCTMAPVAAQARAD